MAMLWTYLIRQSIKTKPNQPETINFCDMFDGNAPDVDNLSEAEKYLLNLMGGRVNKVSCVFLDTEQLLGMTDEYIEE